MQQDRVRRAAIAADAAAVITTPVDTGRAKGNWNVSIGSIDETTTDNTDRGGSEAIARGKSTIEEWKVGRGEIFISNSLPYILALENGSSAQRPEGMTQHALDAARRALNGR